MKDQYVADIGDYGKYSLLKHFEDAGLRIGINWYLTECDGSHDGGKTRYLFDDNMRKYDQIVFDVLKRLYGENNRYISAVEKSRLFHSADYYNEKMEFIGTPSERKAQRDKWHDKGMTFLKDADLIFLDPDNGLFTRNNTTSKNTVKYVLPKEVFDYYKEGHNVVFYCHKGRRTQDKWEEYKRFMFNMLPYSRPLGMTFHKGTQRSYIFLIHPKDYEKYLNVIHSVIEDWQNVFEDEPIDTHPRLNGLYNGLLEFIDDEQPKCDELLSFLDINGMVVRDYYNYISSTPIDVDYELMQIASADLEKSAALLSMLFREDHFSEGSFEKRWRKGEVQKVLQRMLDVINCIQPM